MFVVFGKRDRTPVDLAALGSGGFVIRTVSGAMDIFSGRPVGDVNGDGRADIGVTALEQMGEDAGHVVVVSGRADSAPVVIDEMPAIRGTGGMELGQGLAPAGDRNGDGFGDVLLGAPAPNYARKRGRGAVFVLYGSPTPAADLRWARPFSGFEVDGPPATREFGYAVARAGRGFVAGAPGRGRGGAWIVPGRGARPLQLAPLVTDGPPAWPSPGPRGRARLSAARERALLYSRRGRLLVTYRDLRPGRETPIAVAAAGRDLLLGSLGANRAYIVPAEAGRSAAPRTRSAAAGRRRSAWRARRRRRCDRRSLSGRARRRISTRPSVARGRGLIPPTTRPSVIGTGAAIPKPPPAPNMPTEVTLTVPARHRIRTERESSQ